MARMSGNDKCPCGNVGDSSQWTNWILVSGATYHMTPQISDFIPGSLEDMDKQIEVVDRHHITAKQRGQVRKFNVQQSWISFYPNVTQYTLAP